MIKILTVIGARPQFIKAAAVSRAIMRQSGIYEVIVHTGQHFDENMSEVFFEQMQIPKPTHKLDIHSLPHGAMTGRMTEGIEKIILEEKPQYVMVYGDTNSTLAGALAASKLHIPVAHVEAGLRSFNMAMPEEINRILTDRISKLLFCPTPVAVNNLAREGFKNFACKVITTGDVMYDASLLFNEKALPPSGVDIPGQFALATVHRAENTNDPGRLADIMTALEYISDKLPVIFPVHPRTRKLIDQSGLSIKSDNLLMIDPVGYLEILYLLKHTSLVLTDSGGMQKEAYFFKKPCITLREETEWTELTAAGYNILAGSNPARIKKAFKAYNNKTIHFQEELYGKGNASDIIAEAFLKH